MPLAHARPRRNPVATALRDAVVLLAVLAIGTTVQISFERVPASHGEGSHRSAAPEAHPATVEPEEAIVLPAGSERERRGSSTHADHSDPTAGPAADRGVNVEIPAIATRALRLLSIERS